MKKKFFASLLAGVLALGCLSACTDSDKSVAFSEYWKKNSLSGGEVKESLTYSVKFEASLGLDNLSYTLSYGEGSYVTLLQSTAQGYAYTTEFTVPVSYTYGGETKEFEDKVVTKVEFSNKALRPISSHKEVLSHTPTNGSPNSLADCYAEFRYKIDTVYNQDGSATAKVVYDKTEDVEAHEADPTSFNYQKGDYSYLDNEEILLALRAISSDTTSGKFKVYDPALESMQTIKFSFEKDATNNFAHAFNGAALPSASITYRAASIQLSAQNPGVTQTAWIAKTNDPQSNTNRNVMLRLETPLSYNLGKFVYELKSVETLDN